jgi:hypothetical protein
MLDVACKTGAAPPPKGGAIAEGAYVLSGVEIYGPTGSCNAGTVRGAVYVCGTTWSFAFDQALGSLSASTATATASGVTSYSLTQTCPSAAPSEVISFDATATTLSVYSTNGDTTEVDRYTLR